MTHDAPKQRAIDGRFDYCTTGRAGSAPIGYCLGPGGTFEERWPEEPGALELSIWLGRDLYLADRARYLEHLALFHGDGHETAEEARQCYRRFLLNHRLVFFGDVAGADTSFRCEAPGCEAFTSGGATIQGDLTHWHLCAEHRTRELVDAIANLAGDTWRS